jgi:hypothetical protein
LQGAFLHIPAMSNPEATVRCKCLGWLKVGKIDWDADATMDELPMMIYQEPDQPSDI